jgi:hypothetical protein
MINDQEVHLGKRKYCLICSPYKSGNRQKIHLKSIEENLKTHKFCPRCLNIKPISDFYLRRRKPTDTSSYCINCTSDEAKERQKALKIAAIEYKGGKCKICQLIDDPCVYDFHHRDPQQKEYGFGTKSHGTLEMHKAELDKCDLLCSNCHRKIHSSLGTVNAGRTRI